VPMPHGLCGSAAGANTTVNTVDCCTDARYSPLFDTIATRSNFTSGSCESSSVVCMPIPPPFFDTALTADGAAKQASPTKETASCDTSSSCKQMAHKPPCAKSTQASTALLRPRLMRQTIAIKSGPVDTAMTDTHLTPAAYTSKPSQLQSRNGHVTCVPVAVLQVCNKRGSEVFEQSDELRLEVLSTEINELLRSRLVEVRT
jgi:hypothetical protein